MSRLPSVSVYRLRGWERRAETLLRRAQELSCDMIAALGVEDALTDYSDGHVETAEYLVDVLAKTIKLKKARP